jgi:hypothetical protein
MSHKLLAQFPSLGSYTVGSISSVDFPYDKAKNGENNAEVPPWILAGGSRSYFFANGSDTYVWTTPLSLTTSARIDLNNADGPHEVSLSYIHSTDYSAEIPILNWKRNYYGVYSAASFNHPVQGNVSLGFLHGENKNAVADDGTHYQNTIQQNTPINLSDPLSWSGGNPFHEGWEAYNGIISAAWIPNTQQTDWGQQMFKNELGPIAWPSTGYITKSGVKCTAGLRHPSSIISGNYVYVFYLDAGPYGNNIPYEEGRREGIKLIRAPLSAALDPKGYQAYYRDTAGNDTWAPSLPDGFGKDNMLNFVAVQGPKTTDMMDDSTGLYEEIRFSVAKVQNSDYFIGVEQYIDLVDSSKFKVALRYSPDLMHWTARALIVYTAIDWTHSRMNYPIFLSKDGWSNTEVDISDFYILGTGYTPGSFVNKMHLQESPLPPASAFATAAFLALPNQANALFPNPNMGSFQLNYSITTYSQVEVVLFDLNGRKLRSILDNTTMLPGNYAQNIDISALPNSTYLVALYVNKALHLYRVVKQ